MGGPTIVYLPWRLCRSGENPIGKLCSFDHVGMKIRTNVWDINIVWSLWEHTQSIHQFSALCYFANNCSNVDAKE